ncbi:MAG: phosphoribosylglycinamide formyltransferase [Paludibacteraceae bacterium]|nr:phosphoribosylglycinamide formyltransferase [Paludibacteraceae bacterium]
MKRIAILASGSGSNAENIIKYFSANNEVEVPFVISNRKEVYVHERCKYLGVPSYVIPKADFESGVATKFLLDNKIDLVVLAGFLLRIPDDMLEAYPNKVINIHPSLLPKYGGKGMYGDNVHKAVVENKETESGITIHFLNDRFDEGEHVAQYKCEVLPTDTPEDVATKVHALEYEWYPKVIENIL